MFYLLLESLFIYGNLDEHTDVVVYTSTHFMKIIKQSHLYNDEKITFEINDTYDDIGKSCRSRLDLFNLPSVQRYSKILYLDTDILIKGDINKVFSVCKDDILYVLEEGDINTPEEILGKKFFGNELSKYEDTTGFTSGILLFNNCEAIKTLFSKIKEDTINVPRVSKSLYDQPYIVYNAFKYGLYNNKILKELIVNNNKDINSKFIIHHFPGGPGVYGHKLLSMSQFLNNLKDSTINGNIDRAKKYICDNLVPIIKDCGEKLEGNIFMQHHTTNWNQLYVNKQKNVSNLLLNKNVKILWK